MSTYDFGWGPVPAHRHKNGNGWVADTAYVEDTAWVYDTASVSGNAQVYVGHLHSDITQNHNGLTFQHGFLPMTINGDRITGGCHTKTPDEWLKFLTPKQTQADGMPDWALADYRAFVEWAKRLLEETT